jgi:hypothetical protein
MVIMVLTQEDYCISDTQDEKIIQTPRTHLIQTQVINLDVDSEVQIDEDEFHSNADIIRAGGASETEKHYERRHNMVSFLVEGPVWRHPEVPERQVSRRRLLAPEQMQRGLSTECFVANS